MSCDTYMSHELWYMLKNEQLAYSPLLARDTEVLNSIFF